MKTLIRICASALALISCVSAADARITCITAEKGWDIYKAGVYRYGPSFITNADGSIDAWFAAPGQGYEDCTLYKESTCTPYKVGDYKAQYIKTDKPFVGFQILSPTWSSNGTESLRLTIYRWDKDIATTRQGTPLARKTYNKYNDNDKLSVKAPSGTKLEAGEYLLVLDEATDNAGIWYYSQRNTLLESWSSLGGNVKSNGALRGFLLFDDSGITDYWDQASYQHSKDGGKTWTPEKMVLKPTRFTRDQYSVCDPAVVKASGWYYMGYTSTEHSGGLENHLYVARSQSPEGPWEKWNGNGWGGDSVEPIVEYAYVGQGGWGVGEPSFVEHNGLLYIYYTFDFGTPKTFVATAPADDPNWPSAMHFYGNAITKRGGCDHCDVKYVDAAKCFLAVHTSKRMSTNAYIEYWQSEDGIHFESCGKIEGIISPSGCHNCGLNGDERGHIDVTKPQHIAFAYGLNDDGTSKWGCWSTFLQPLKIETDNAGVKSNFSDDFGITRRFNLQGIEIKNGENPSGLVIEVCGGKVSKKIF